MDDSILVLLCSCWLLVYGPDSCRASKCVTANIFTDNATMIGIFPNTLCCGRHNDYTPFLIGFSYQKRIFVGVGIKGPFTELTDKGFQSFVVYASLNGGMYKSIREGNPKNRRAKIFPGLTKADIERDKKKVFQFDYPVEADRLKMVFKLRHGQNQLCVTVFYFCGCKLKETALRHSCDVRIAND
ncbi:uncharacterized protein LOC121383790 [Gigantopelta aegis]|uniref:uncharacterized protein LOC121383790 n=1 Tax=Gigantopelta aegis TaxID=1735272 RepID=UPI001B88A8A8|nr:uncharacterized protein LOC121383790 [Gigantopelta aegis]